MSLTFYSVIHTQGRVQDPRHCGQIGNNDWNSRKTQYSNNNHWQDGPSTCRKFISELQTFERTILWPPFFIGVSLSPPRFFHSRTSSLSKHAFVNDVFSRTFNVIRTSKSIILDINILFVCVQCVWRIFGVNLVFACLSFYFKERWARN